MCQRSDGASVSSFVDLKQCDLTSDIYNQFGQLMCTPSSPSGGGGQPSGGGGTATSGKQSAVLYFELAWLVLWIVLTMVMVCIVALKSTFRLRKLLPTLHHPPLILLLQFVCWVLSLAAMADDDWAVSTSSPVVHFGLVSVRQSGSVISYKDQWNGGASSRFFSTDEKNFLNTEVIAAYFTLIFGVLTVVSASAAIIAALPFVVAACRGKPFGSRHKAEKAQRLWQSATHIQFLTALAAIMIWGVCFYQQSIDLGGATHSSESLGASWCLFIVVLVGSLLVMFLPDPYPSLDNNNNSDVDGSMSRPQVSGMYVPPVHSSSAPPPYDVHSQYNQNSNSNYSQNSMNLKPMPSAAGYVHMMSGNVNNGYVSVNTMNYSAASAPPLPIVNSNRVENAFCTGCGGSLRGLSPDQRFCGNCGKPIPR